VRRGRGNGACVEQGKDSPEAPNGRRLAGRPPEVPSGWGDVTLISENLSLNISNDLFPVSGSCKLELVLCNPFPESYSHFFNLSQNMRKTPPRLAAMAVAEESG